jgi:hypothetical protein
LHGFSGVFLPGNGWYRVDPRGNRPGIDAQFEPPSERLAFQPSLPDEFDLEAVWPEPLPAVVAALRRAPSAKSLGTQLPDVSLGSGPPGEDGDEQERSILEALDAAVGRDSVIRELEPIVARVFTKLSADPGASMAWEDVPLEVFGSGLPNQIRSSWVFILRAGATTGAERHPNSHQRMMSLRGVGDLQMGGPGRWRSNILADERDAELESRWVSVPTNVWHQAVVPEEDWVVVSFHTASAQALLEERLDVIQPGGTRRRTYV